MKNIKDFIVESRANEIEMLRDYETFKEYFEMLFTSSKEFMLKYFLKHTGLISVIDEKDETSFSDAIDAALQKCKDFQKWCFGSIQPKDNDWEKIPQHDEKEYQTKRAVLNDALKDLYKLLCDLVDKYDEDIDD